MRIAAVTASERSKSIECHSECVRGFARLGCSCNVQVHLPGMLKKNALTLWRGRKSDWVSFERGVRRSRYFQLWVRFFGLFRSYVVARAGVLFCIFDWLVAWFLVCLSLPASASLRLCVSPVSLSVYLNCCRCSRYHLYVCFSLISFCFHCLLRLQSPSVPYRGHSDSLSGRRVNHTHFPPPLIPSSSIRSIYL